MVDEVERKTLSESAARQLANATKTHAQWGGITPRWLVNFLTWTPVEAGIFRLNRVKEEGSAVTDVECSPPRDRNPDLPETFVDYVDNPREYFLKAVTTVLDVQTRVSDLYSQPFDQVQEQLRLLIEKVKERQESELINYAEYGLLASVAPSQRIKTRKGPPTPDDLDELLTKVWKEPSLLPRPSARDRGLWPGMHAPWRAAADRHSVRNPSYHLARRAAGSVRQGQDRRGQRDRDQQDLPDPHRREEAGRGWPLPAGRSR